MWRSPWIYVVILFIALMALLAFCIHQADVISQQQVRLQTVDKQRDLGDGATASGNTVGSDDDVRNAAEDAGMPMGKVEKDAKAHGADITGTNVARATSDGQQATGVASSSSIPRQRDTPGVDRAHPGGDPGEPGGDRHLDGPGGEGKLPQSSDPWGYQNAGQVLKLHESFGGGKERVPFGQVVFRAWEQNPWSLDVPPRTYTAVTVLATDEDGKQTAYNRLSVEVEGKAYALPIKDAQLTQKLPEAKWRWSGKLYLGAGAGLHVPSVSAEVAPSAMVSIGSYGKTPLMPDWTVGAIGVGYATQSRAPAVVVTPALWNAGKPLPLVDNLFVGPSVSADARGAVSIMVSAHVKM